MFLTKELITYAQSVYMHEAQEDNGELDFETFLQSLVIIIPGFLIWLLISSYIKDNKIKKGQAIRQLKKQKEDERERQYQRDSENFRAKLNCTNFIYINGHKAVDLGLQSSILWGVENIGAENNMEVGDIYGWGDYEKININETYLRTWSNRCAIKLVSDEEYEDIKYDYDAAIKIRGAMWRTPTEMHFIELQNDCKWEYIDNFGIVGWKVTGPNGNFIFFPIKYKWHNHESRSWKNLYDMILLTTSFPKEDNIIATEVGLSKKAIFYDINGSSHNIIIRNRVNCGYIRPIAFRSIDVKSDIELALCYLRGTNVKKDTNRAVHILYDASERNDAEAQRILGLLYLKGQDIGRNLKRALSLLRLSGTQGDVQALHFLGDYYQHEKNKDRDMALAILYYTKAGNLKDVKSILSLIELFLQKENKDFFGNEQFNVFVEGIRMGIIEVSRITEVWLKGEDHADSDGVALYSSNGLRLVGTIADRINPGSSYNGHVVSESMSSKTIESYEIKMGTRVIGQYAFERCWKLANIKIPTTVNFIGAYAFIGCTMLDSVVLPNSLVYIGDRAFDCDDHAKIQCTVHRQKPIKIYLPSSVEIIEGNPFCYKSIINNWNPRFKVIDNVLFSANGKILISYCSSEVEYTVPSSVKEIGKGAFRNTPIKIIHLPDSLEIINESAFENSGIKEIKFPSSLKEIRAKAFDSCNFRDGKLVLPSNIETIDFEAFQFTWSVKIIRVPKGRIEHYKYILPEWVTEQIVDDETLYENGLYLNLERNEIISSYDISNIVVIPKGITTIRNNAFVGIYNIDIICFPKSLINFSAHMFDDEVNIGKINVPIGYKDYFASKLSDFEDIIEEIE